MTMKKKNWKDVSNLWIQTPQAALIIQVQKKLIHFFFLILIFFKNSLLQQWIRAHILKMINS